MGKNTDQIPDYSGSEYVDRFLAEKILNNNITNNPNNPEYENEKLKFELKELAKEIDNAKKRRDMAFNERDKMIKERESIRALLDDMRHQRDKAISELAESISECDELRKQKTQAYRQIQILEKNLTVMEEKLAYFRELHELKEDDEHEKHDDDTTKKSFDSDELNWKTLKIEIDLTENADLGIELAYASKLIEKLETNDDLDKSLSEINNLHQVNMSPKLHKANNLNVYDDHSLEKNKPKLHKANSDLDVNEEHIVDDQDEKSDVNQYDEIGGQLEDDGTFTPDDKLGQDEFILISDIDDNGLAYGKLKIFDRLLKINDIDVQKSTAEDIKQIIMNSKNTISFIVSRHFGKSADCLVRKSSVQHLNEEEMKEDTKRVGGRTGVEEEDIDEEIISTSMSLITTSTTSNSNLQLQKSNYYSNGSHDESTFKFERTDINRYKQQHSRHTPPPTLLRQSFRETQSNSNKKKMKSPSDNESQESNSLDLISINKCSLNDLLLETGVYVSNIVRKQSSELKIGDRILSINGHSLTNKTLYEIMDLVNNATQFNLVVKKSATSSSSYTSKSTNKRPRKSLSQTRGFIVVSKSNLSNTSSVSLLNHTIRNTTNEKVDINALKTSSNLIFNIKDQKEVRKQIEANNQAMKAIKQQHQQQQQRLLLINESDLVKQQKQCKQYYDKQIETLEQKEQALLDENMIKYQELIKNFHTQSRKANHLFVDIDVEAAVKKNSKSSLFKFHKTSPRIVEDLDKPYLSNTSNASVNAASTTAVESAKRVRKNTNAQNTDTMKFNYRRLSHNQDNNLNLF